MKYEIMGSPFPVVTCNLSAGESVVCQKGAMTWMTDNMTMETGTGGGLGKIFSKALSGESIFQNTYTALGTPGTIAIWYKPSRLYIIISDFRRKKYYCSEISISCIRTFSKF